MMSPFGDTRKVHALILQQERQADVVTNRDNGGSHTSYQSTMTEATNRVATSIAFIVIMMATPSNNASSFVAFH